MNKRYIFQLKLLYIQFIFQNIAINSLQGVLEEQKRNDFERYNSHSVSNLYASTNATPIMGMTNNSSILSQQNFDINAQLRKLLIVTF